MMVSGVDVAFVLWMQATLLFVHFFSYILIKYAPQKTRLLNSVYGIYLALIFICLFNIINPVLPSGSFTFFNGVLMLYSAFLRNFGKLWIPFQMCWDFKI